MKKQLFTFLALLITGIISAQVGIGTTTPSQALDVETNEAAGTAIDINNTGTGDPKINLQLNGTTTFSIGVDNDDADKLKIGTTAPETNTRVTIDNTGNVGVGTSTPGAKLDVDGSAIFNESGAAVNFRVESDANANMLFIDGTNNRVGVGTGAPDATFQVNGSFKLVDGNQSNGKVLTSDANGVATWQTASGGGLPAGTSGQTLRHDGTTWVANSVLFNNGTNVGIGTTSPTSGLDVQTSLGYADTTITSATSLDNTHNVVLCNTGPYIVTLPAAASNRGRVYYIKNIDATNRAAIYIDGNSSETIDGNLTFTLNSYNSAIRVISDGSGWHVIESSGTIQPSFDVANCYGSVFTWAPVISTTGRIWMDRNLGATQVATSTTDTSSYGDLYQWGRLKDGHQCRNSTTTATSSDDDIPNHGLWITAAATATQDWRTTQNTMLWQGVSGINNPCPNGYRIPTVAEFVAERNAFSSFDAAGALASPLALPSTGSRFNTGGFFGVGTQGMYWTSDVSGTGALRWIFTSSSASTSGGFRPRTDANAVRCIKD